MSMTNEQIKQIIDGAPSETNQYEQCGKYWYVNTASNVYIESPMHNLSDLAEIFALRERVTELEIEFEKLQRAADRAGLRMIKAGLVSEFEKLDSVLCSYPLKLPKESANERD